MLDETRKSEFKSEFVKIWSQNNIGSDSNTIVDAEYLEVVAVKR